MSTESLSGKTHFSNCSIYDESGAEIHNARCDCGGAKYVETPKWVEAMEEQINKPTESLRTLIQELERARLPAVSNGNLDWANGIEEAKTIVVRYEQRGEMLLNDADDKNVASIPEIGRIVKGTTIANAIMRAFNEGRDSYGKPDGDSWRASQARKEFNLWCDGPDYSPKREYVDIDRSAIAKHVMIAMQMLEHGDYSTPWNKAVTIMNTVFESLNIPITKIEAQ